MADLLFGQFGFDQQIGKTFVHSVILPPQVSALCLDHSFTLLCIFDGTSVVYLIITSLTVRRRGLRQTSPMPPNRLKFLSGEFLQIHSFIQKDQPTDGKMMNKSRNESADSLWDVDFELADQRISARRNRIRQRLDAVKKVQKMIQVKHIFGYTGGAAGEQFPVQVGLDFRQKQRS